MVQHRRVHRDDRPLKCPWKGCKMTFKWAWTRTEHIRFTQVLVLIFALRQALARRFDSCQISVVTSERVVIQQRRAGDNEGV
ncbi:hypothetical protein L1049_028008 [Liquidambar formosana]|uniref:C2H2-type domain-containing protein n=1 Tax=Liquidambar formosana TaxID=63359 RepID=A0AAP0RJQ6_LIQFO